MGKVEERKVWVGYIDYGYEGCSEPAEVFASKALAKAWESGDMFYRNIVELPLQTALSEDKEQG